MSNWETSALMRWRNYMDLKEVCKKTDAEKLEAIVTKYYSRLTNEERADLRRIAESLESGSERTILSVRQIADALVALGSRPPVLAAEYVKGEE